VDVSELWSGRFNEPLDQTMRRFSTSLPFDRRLVREDLEGSRAHAAGLVDAGLLDEAQLAELRRGLDAIEAEVEAGTFPPPDDAPDVPEDIHSAVEQRLVEIVGDLGRRLHAGRSRNDQVVTDVLLWLKGASLDVEAGRLYASAARAARAHGAPPARPLRGPRS
jgi:argininosuccinate lyase